MSYDEQMDDAFESLQRYEQEIEDHNKSFFDSLNDKDKKDFEVLLDDCELCYKINYVDEPKGNKQDEDCGSFKNIHVDQWCTNMDGDSFQGNIYALFNNRWVEIPFTC